MKEKKVSTTTEIDPKTKCASCGFTRDAHWGPRPIAAPFCTGFVAPKHALQPAPDAEGEWRVVYDDRPTHSANYHIREHGNGDCIAHAATERQAWQIVRDHSAVPKLVEALRDA